MSDHLSTQELINRIESKDRRFRLAQSLFMILLLATLTGIIFVQFRTLDAVREQLIAQKATSAERSTQNTELQDKIIRRLDCIVVFFSQTDRSSLSIDDVDKCSLNRDKDIEQFFRTPESTPSSQPSKVKGEPEDNGTTPPFQSSPSLTPTPGTTTPEENPPVRVLGIPVCIPFTGVCLR